MQIITAAVIKGGTGKTTTCTALAQAAVKAGKKVLAIDLDPQANFTNAIGADQTRPGSYQLLNGTPAEQLIQQTPQGIAAISASPDLATVKTTPASAKRLQKALEPLHGVFDVCFIDVPPMLGELLYNALQASTGLIIPLETDTNSLQGLYHITDIANQMQHSNPDLKIIGVILTRYDNRPKINRFLQSEIEAKGQEVGAPYLMAIRSGIAVREAMAMQQSLFDYAPHSKPATDYERLYKKIMEEDEQWLRKILRR